jgi:parallel beta-helix repeat protein
MKILIAILLISLNVNAKEPIKALIEQPNEKRFVLTPFPHWATTYYLSAAGSDGNPGTIGSPKLSLGLADTYLVAGDILYVRDVGGTYTEGGAAGVDVQIRLSNMDGNVTDSIFILAYPGETPVFDWSGTTHTGSDCYGLYIEYSDYWRIQGITFMGMLQHSSGNTVRGVILDHCTHNLFNGNTITNIGGDGLFIYYSDDNVIQNNDVSYCADPHSGSPYDGANGIGSTASSNTSTRNCYKYNRTWFISDDGMDFFGKGGSDTLIGNWSFNNGYIGSFTTAGNGDGYKLGPYNGNTTTISRFLFSNLAVGNRLIGFDMNYNSSNQYPVELYNNTGYNNLVYNFYFGSGDRVSIFTNNLEYLSANAADINAQSTETTNSWQGGVTVSGADFQSLDTSLLNNARNADYTLPTITTLHLVADSDLRNAGTQVGYGLDLGCFQYPSEGLPNFIERRRRVINKP